MVDGVPLSALAPVVRTACERLRDALLALLGDDMAALWAYGAAVSPEPPRRLGDVDVHSVLRKPPSQETASAIESAQRRIESDLSIDLDAWYILLDAARGVRPPAHLLSPRKADEMWALHRSHLLSGRYVLLHGATPGDVVTQPAWGEVLAALRHELEYIEDCLHPVESEPFAPYAVLNCCRIAHTLATENAAVTKQESASWALTSLPQQWHEPVLAAVRWYDNRELPGDDRLLRDASVELVGYVRGLLPHDRGNACR